MPEHNQADETGIESDIVGRNGLVALFGDVPRARIIAALSRQQRPLTAAQVSEVAGVDRSTFHRHKDDLLATGVVVEADSPGSVNEYELAGGDAVEALQTVEALVGAEVHDKDYSGEE